MTPSPPRTRLWLSLVLLLTLLIRVGVAVRAGERPLAGDEISYDQIAWNLASGKGYSVGTAELGLHPTATRGPAFVLSTAAFYRLAGRKLVPPAVGNAVLEVLACWLAFRIARRVFSSEAAGLGAALIYAIYPPFTVYATMLLPEAFTNTTVLAAVDAFLRFAERRRVRDLVVTGVSLGLCALNKPHAALVGAVLALTALPLWGLGATLRRAIVITGVTALVMTPWLVRNARVFHAFIPGVTQGGVSFWGGTAPFGGRFVGGLQDAWVPMSFQKFIYGLDEVEQNRWFMHDALRIITADPRRYAKLTLRKFFQYWLNLGYDDPPSKASYALAALNLLAIALAAYAVRGLSPDRLAVRVLLGFGAYWAAVGIAVCTVVRYAMPSYALLLCFTGAAVAALAARFTGRALAGAPPGRDAAPRLREPSHP